jgi:hypothetical protein
MLDEEWLNSLDFIGIGGMRIHGLVGLGSENIVFGATSPDGEKLVTKVHRHHLGFYIKEIPLFLSETPHYNVDRVNIKLLNLVGNPMLDELTCEFDRMFSSIINILHKLERMDNDTLGLAAAFIPMMLGNKLAPYCPESIHFAIATPQVKRRLGEIASLPEPGSDADPSELFPRVNGPNFPIVGTRNSLVKWATTMLELREALVPSAPFDPESLSDDPLFVWGAAVMDGFFTDEELPKVASFLEQKFGRLPSHPQAGIFMQHIDALCHLLTGVLKDSEVSRFVDLCGRLGFMLDVHDANGKKVASSMKLF